MKTEHVAGHIQKFPSQAEIRRIRARLKVFEKIYIAWLTEFNFAPEPMPEEFGLKRCHVFPLVMLLKMKHRAELN